jgi:ankyrin repeat protein
MTLHVSATGDLEGGGRDGSSSPENMRQPLWLAAKYGRENDVVERLGIMEITPSPEIASVEINSTDTEDRTALWWAVRNGHKKIVERLLENPQVDVNKPSSESRTPLHEAAFHGHIEIASLLLKEARTDLNYKDTIFDSDSLASTHHTPLYVATVQGHWKIVELLLKYAGVDVNSRTGDKRAPLHAAAEHGRVDIVQLLLEHGGIELAPSQFDGATPLHLAAANGHKEVVEKLLTGSRFEEMVNMRNEQGASPLHAAAAGGHHTVVPLLAQFGDPDLRDDEHQTPLHAAAKNGHVEVVKVLLAIDGITVHARNKKQQTPLYSALANGFKDVAELLLHKDGFDTKTRYTFERALFKWAVMRKDSVTLKFLLVDKSTRTEAEINAKDENKETLLRLAAVNRDKDIMSLLLKRDNVTLHLLVREGDEALVKVLLKAGYDVGARDTLYRTALHLATMLGNFSIAQELLSAGAHVDAQDANGNTPLRIAIQRKHCKLIDKFLEHSADTKGVTTHEWLAAYGKQRPDAVKLCETSSGKKTIHFFKESKVSEEIRQIRSTPGAERSLL